MRLCMLKSKIHRATVTGADVEYEGSVTLDSTLMDAADILPYEVVSIWDVTNGARFDTYAIPAQPDSGVVCINGAAARLVSVSDLVIIASFAEMDDAEARAHKPVNVFVDEYNRIVGSREERPGQGDLKVV